MESPSIIIEEEDVENLWQWSSVLGSIPIIVTIRHGHIHARTDGDETEIIKYGTDWRVPYERKARYSSAQFAAAVNQVRNSGAVQFSIGAHGHLYLRRYPEIVLPPLVEPSRPKDAT
jgi:hypothetical protein